MNRLAWMGFCSLSSLALVYGCGDSGSDGGGSGGTTASNSSTSGNATTQSASSVSGSQSTSNSASNSASTDASSSSSQASSSSTGLANCTEVTWAYSKTVTNADAASIRGIISPNIGDPQNDLLEFDFYGDATGVIDLAAGTNSDWYTCLQCAWGQQDAAGNVVQYMPLSGTMTIDASSTPTTGDVTFQVSNLTLIEVTLDDMTSTTTPVADGRCITLQTATFSPP